MLIRKCFVVLIFLFLPFSSAFALPDAVCNNGKHVGNPHCTASPSVAPIQAVGAGLWGATAIFLSIGGALTVSQRKS